MSLWKWLLLLVGIVAVMAFVVTCSTAIERQNDPTRKHTIEYIEGRVTSIEEIGSRTWGYAQTKVYLDNGSWVIVKGDVKFQFDHTYRFTFFKYDDWISHDSVLQKWDMIQ